MNQFINSAVAEKLAHLQHEEWMHNCKKPAPDQLTKALNILDKATGTPPDAGDELPEGYGIVNSGVLHSTQ